MLPEDLGIFADYLDNHSISGVNTECLRRVSCGRHYYQIFHIMRTWLSNNFTSHLTSSGGATHKTLRVCCELLSESYSDPSFKKLALKLKMLHDLRVYADYNLEDDFSEGSLIAIQVEKVRTLKLINEIEVKYCGSSSPPPSP